MNIIQAKTILLHGNYYELINKQGKIVTFTYSVDTVTNLMMAGKIFVTQKCWFMAKKKWPKSISPRKNDKSYAGLSSKKKKKKKNEITDTLAPEMMNNHILRGYCTSYSQKLKI